MMCLTMLSNNQAPCAHMRRRLAHDGADFKIREYLTKKNQSNLEKMIFLIVNLIAQIRITLSDRRKFKSHQSLFSFDYF